MRRHLIAAGTIAAAVAVLAAVRVAWIEPRAMGLACVHGTGPAAVCALRAGVNWMSHYAVWGTVALGLGVWALVAGGLPIAAAAICAGAAGVINYNVSWGMLGVALGAWAWLRPAPATPRRAAG